MTDKPGVLQSMGSQSVRQDLVTEQQQWLIVKIACIFGELVRLSWLIHRAQLHFFLKVSIPTDKKYMYQSSVSRPSP